MNAVIKNFQSGYIGRPPLFRLALLSILIAASLPVVAQPANEFVLNEKNGLCDNGVNGLVTDVRGFLWIATENGLARYDGQHCQNFYRANSPLRSNQVYDIVRLKPQQLLLATANGLVTLNTHTQAMQTFQMPDETELYRFRNSFDRILVLPGGMIATYSKYGFYVFDSAMKLLHKIEAGFTEEDIGVKRIHFGLRMEAFPNGDILLATTDGYFVFHAERRSSCKLQDCSHGNYAALWQLIAPRASSYIYNINNRGQLFFLDNKSSVADTLFTYNIATGETNCLRLPFVPRYEIRWDGKFQFHPDGSITLNRSLRGVYEFRLNEAANSWENLPELKARDYQVFSVAHKTGNLRVYGTATGLVFQKEDNPAVRYIPVPDLPAHLDASFIKNALKLNDRIYFTAFGPEGNVISLNAASGKDKKIYTFSYQGRRALVRDMQLWHRDSLILGTEEGLMLLSLQTGEAVPFHEIYPLTSAMTGFVHTLWYDGTNELWVSFNNQHGLWRYHRSTGKGQNFLNGQGDGRFPLKHAENIIKDTEGNMWFHHVNDGITRFNTKLGVFDLVKRFVELPNKQQQQIAGIAKAASPGLWLYLNGFGLYFFDPATGNSRQELAMFDRVETHVNPLALSKTGLLSLNLKNNLLLYDTRNKKISKLTNPQKNATLQNNLKRPFFDESSGLLLTGYSNLFLLWDFQTGSADTPAPKVYITNIETTNDSLTHNGLAFVKLKSRQNDLRIHFGSPDFEDLSSPAFEFTLEYEGNKQGWTNIGTQHFVQLTNLIPGNYSFSVRRLSPVTGQEETADSFQFSIAAPYYATWWFRLLVILAIASILYLLYKMRIKQLLKIEAMRASISADLHDDIGSRHTNAQLLTALARKEAGTSNNVLKYLDQIQSEIGVSAESLNEIVWNMKTADEHLDSMVARMRKYAGELLENDEIEYRFRSESSFQNRVMTMGKRRDLFLVFKEVLTNIRKHAAASFVEIDIGIKNDQFYMKLSDNGKGFERDIATDRNGLNNLHNRIARQKGNMAIHTSPGAGTAVIIFVPFDKVSPLRVIRSFINKN